jgi:hypothetical protein
MRVPVGKARLVHRAFDGEEGLDHPFHPFVFQKSPFIFSNSEYPRGLRQQSPQPNGERAGVIMILVALNIVSVALTWSVGGRFMVSVQPLLAACHLYFARQVTFLSCADMHRSLIYYSRMSAFPWWESSV